MAFSLWKMDGLGRFSLYVIWDGLLYEDLICLGLTSPFWWKQINGYWPHRIRHEFQEEPNNRDDRTYYLILLSLRRRATYGSERVLAIPTCIEMTIDQCPISHGMVQCPGPQRRLVFYFVRRWHELHWLSQRQVLPDYIRKRWNCIAEQLARAGLFHAIQNCGHGTPDVVLAVGAASGGHASKALELARGGTFCRYPMIRKAAYYGHENLTLKLIELDASRNCNPYTDSRYITEAIRGAIEGGQNDELLVIVNRFILSEPSMIFAAYKYAVELGRTEIVRSIIEKYQVDLVRLRASENFESSFLKAVSSDHRETIKLIWHLSRDGLMRRALCAPSRSDRTFYDRLMRRLLYQQDLGARLIVSSILNTIRCGWARSLTLLLELMTQNLPPELSENGLSRDELEAILITCLVSGEGECLEVVNEFFPKLPKLNVDQEKVVHRLLTSQLDLQEIHLEQLKLWLLGPDV